MNRHNGSSLCNSVLSSPPEQLDCSLSDPDTLQKEGVGLGEPVPGALSRRADAKAAASPSWQLWPGWCIPRHRDLQQTCCLCHLLCARLHAKGRRGRGEPQGIYFLSTEKDEPYTDCREHRDEPPRYSSENHWGCRLLGSSQWSALGSEQPFAGLPGLQSHLIQSHACPGMPTFSASIKVSIKVRHFGPTWDKPEGVISPAKVPGVG